MMSISLNIEEGLKFVVADVTWEGFSMQDVL